jgi:hypothetical protein
MLARVTAALAAALVLAAAAEGKLYLDERFDGAGLPEGWTYRIEKTAGWSINSGGPWGNYLYMYAVGYPHVGDGRINVDTKHVGVAAGSMYYRFGTYRTWSGYTLVRGIGDRRGPARIPSLVRDGRLLVVSRLQRRAARGHGPAIERAHDRRRAGLAGPR